VQTLTPGVDYYDGLSGRPDGVPGCAGAAGPNWVQNALGQNVFGSGTGGFTGPRSAPVSSNMIVAQHFRIYVQKWFGAKGHGITLSEIKFSFMAPPPPPPPGYYSNWRVHITERSAGAGSVCTIAVQLYDGDTQHDTSEFATQSSASGAYNGASPSANYGSQNPWNSANTLDWCSELDTGTQDSYVQYHFHSAVKVTKYKLAPPKTSNDCTRASA
jgi:hypothetical protein